MRSFSFGMFVLLCSFLSSCTVDSPASPESERALLAVSPMCQQGYCVPAEDPYPDSAGVFINTYDELECFDGVENDVDEDGIGDACEFALAQAFAPLMNFSYGDDVSREPKWAVRYSDGLVYIAYFMAYYNDAGVQGNFLACARFVLFCDAHWEDSEAILFRVTYVSTTQHWLLVDGLLSGHDGYNLIDSPFPNGHPYASGIGYGDKLGGYPIVFVSENKHANYVSDSECDSGGKGNLDNCSTSLSPARLEIYGNANLGGYAHQFVDCVYSGSPFYSSNQECFWSGSRFGGWQGINPDSDPYRDRLADFGFIP